MINRLKKIISLLLILQVIFSLTGCGDKNTHDVRIILETADGSIVDTTDENTPDAVFPRFVSKDEALQKDLDKLNKETDKVRKSYEKRTDKGKIFTVSTYVSSVKNVPQCTLCWYEEHSIIGDDYNLMTLAYNKKTGEIITSKEALNSLEIDGITLSTNVNKAYTDQNFPGTVTETEMQGFETDENGSVTAVYMKLITEITETDSETGEEENTEEFHFYLFDPAANTLSPLSESEFPVP